MDGGDILTHGLLPLDFHHERDSANEHAVVLTHARIAASVIDGGVSHLVLAQDSGEHITECRLEYLIRRETLLLAPAVHHRPADVGRLLPHLAHRVLGAGRQCGQIQACIFLLHHALGTLVLVVTQAGILVGGSLQHAVLLHGQGLALVGQRQVALREQNQITRTVSHHVVDVHQQVVLRGGRYQFSPDERLIAHDVEGAAEAVVGIVLEVSFRHPATRDGQRLAIVDILAGLAVVIDDKAYPQFLPRRENGLYGGLHAVKVNVAGQGHDARDVILHHIRILHAVIEDSQL